MSTAFPFTGDVVAAAIAREIYAAPEGLQVSELATDRSTSTVTRALAVLKESGVIVDGEMRKSAGRPAATFQIPSELGVVGVSVIGVDGQPATLEGVVTDLVGRPADGYPPLRIALKMHQRGDADELAQAIADLAIELAEQARGEINVVGLGVSFGGYVRNGVLLRFPGLVWEPYDLQTKLHELTGFAVRVENDANAFAAGLAVRGEVSNRGSIAVLCMFGDGIGGAWIVDGRVRRGARGAAMEPGHLAVAPDDDLFTEPAGMEPDHKCRCGAMGCVEAYAAPSRIRAALAAAKCGRGVPFEDAAMNPTDGEDPVATAAFRRAGYALGRGIGNIVNTFDPDLVLLYAPSVLANPVRGSLAEEWRRILFGTVARSDFGNPSDDIEEVKKRIHILGLTSDPVASNTAAAASALIAESLFEQIAGTDVLDTSLLTPTQLGSPDLAAL